jgi:heat-inducible transcriptional repressor
MPDDQDRMDDRKLAVLRAIVSDYVNTREPVGSKSLVEKYQLGVSSATVRNDMAALEEDGYITQPHTSAGRIPTDKGYRLFVDRLGHLRPLSAPERRAIAQFFASAVDLEDVVGRTVRLLSQLTRQVAMMRYPSLSSAAVRHVEMVPLAPRRLLAVVILSNGRVEQHVVDLSDDLGDELLADIRHQITALCAGRTVKEAAAQVAVVAARFPQHQRSSVAEVSAGVLEALVDRGEERLAVAGTANLTAFGPDFETTIRPVLQALEEQVVLLHLLGEAGSSAVTVRIGSENPQLTTASLVAASYGGASDVAATLGVLGPTRMDYPSTMTAVAAVARYVSRILSGD